MYHLEASRASTRLACWYTDELRKKRICQKGGYMVEVISEDGGSDFALNLLSQHRCYITVNIRKEGKDSTPT